MQVARGPQLLRIVNCALSWRKPFLQSEVSPTLRQCGPPMVPTKEPKLSANLRRPCRFACLTLQNHLQSCPLYKVLFYQFYYTTCQMKCQTVRCEILQSAFISAGGSLSSAGAQLVLQDLKGEKRRGEDVETSLASESVLKWPLTWTRFRCCRRNAACGANIYHKTMQMCSLPAQKKTQKSLSEKSNRRERERERERERVGISKTKQRNVKPNLLLFGLFTLPDSLASPDWNLPPRRIAIYQKAKAFCKSSSSWPLCMFDSADVSPPRVPTKEPRLSANLRRPGQFACLTLHSRLQSCPPKTSVLLKLPNEAPNYAFWSCRVLSCWWVIEQWWGGHDPGR